jgi:polysaccharide biosynthesis transport protein
VIATVATTVLIMKPVFVPVARIEVDPPGAEFFSLQGSDMRSDPSEYAETQAKILQSDQLALAVIRKLHLDHNGEFVKSPSSATSPSPDLTPAEYQALKSVRKGLDVQRDSASWLINVSFAAHEPKLAALVANTVIEQFIESNYKTRHDAIEQSTKWLSKQLDDIRVRLAESNHALAVFQEHSDITPSSGEHNTFDERMTELNHQLAAAQADRIQLEALLDKVNRLDASRVPQVTSDPVVQELSKKLGNTRADLSQALVLYGINHPRVRELRSQVDELQTQVSAQENRILDSLKTSYAAHRTREALLDQELKGAKGKWNQMAQYEALKKNAQVDSDLYNTLYTKIKEAGITAESKSPNIRWIDRAPVLDSPTRPHRGLVILVGVLFGVVGGIMFAVLRAKFDSTVRTLEDIRSSTGLSSITLLPSITGEPNGKQRLKWPPQHEGVEGSPQVLLFDRPNSPEAEAVRALLTSVQLSDLVYPPQALLIASSLPREGKTTVAVNLAIALSRYGHTCIVDADLRKAGVAKILGISHQRGLADVLQHSCSLDEALVPARDSKNLLLLPGGPAEHVTSELLSRDAMRTVLHTLREKFEFIVVDSPPVLPYAEARAISPLVDGIIFVGLAGVTKREVMERSLELLEQVHSAPVLEVVLNGVGSDSPDYNRYGYTSYESQK